MADKLKTITVTPEVFERLVAFCMRRLAAPVGASLRHRDMVAYVLEVAEGTDAPPDDAPKRRRKPTDDEDPS